MKKVTGKDLASGMVIRLSSFDNGVEIVPSQVVRILDLDESEDCRDWDLDDGQVGIAYEVVDPDTFVAYATLDDRASNQAEMGVGQDEEFDLLS